MLKFFNVDNLPVNIHMHGFFAAFGLQEEQLGHHK